MRVFLLLVFLGSVLFGSHRDIKHLERVSLQLHWKYQFEFAGFIAAKEKGFYKQAGLDVTLKEYNHGVDIEKDVIEGKSQYGIYNSLSLLEYLQGKPIVLVSSYFKRAALVLVTTPDIKSPKDLVGKKIMASTREDFELNFQPYFDGYGVNLDDVTLVPHTYNIDAFASGKVSAMTAFVSNELSKLDEKGISYNILDPSDDNLYVLQLELFTSKKEALEHPQRVKAFREASIRGWEYALSHKDELADIIYNKYTKRVPKEAIIKEAIGVEKLILPYTYNIGSIDKNFLSKQIALFKKYYNVGQDKDIDDFIFHAPKEERLKLTLAEKQYIKKHPSIDVCLQYDQFPIDGYRDGKFVGIASDIYELISHSSSLKFHPIPTNSVEDLKHKIDTKQCQLLSLYGTKNSIYKTLKPTKTFIETNFTFITTLDKSFITDMHELEGKTIVTQLQAYKDYMLHYYPNLTIKVQNNKNIMIKHLISGDVYAIVTLDEQADYIINRYGYGKLKVNGFFPKEYNFDGSIGVQEDEVILFGIIQKAIDHISKAQIREIVDSWKITRYQSITDYALLWKILVVMGIIFLIMFYYQLKLKHFNKELESLVDEKTQALRKMNESLEATVAEKIQELLKKDEILTAQSKQAVMGEMISMIAHQWRQPLNTITLQISNLQIQQMMGNKIDETTIAKILSDINETIVYLSETIDDFKTYFHPNKEVTTIELEEFISKVVNFITPRLKSNNVEIEVMPLPKTQITIYVNELIQVLLNIINNAIDAYENKDLQSKKIILKVDIEGDLLNISIQDYAGGIKKKFKKKIFEPYFSTKGKNGTGLGLYMSQMIIQKQFDGKINVKSSSEGSTFIVQIRKNLK